MRLTWRLRPSLIVMLSQVVGISFRSLTGGFRAHSVGSLMMLTLAGNVRPSFNSTPVHSAAIDSELGSPST